VTGCGKSGRLPYRVTPVVYLAYIPSKIRLKYCGNSYNKLFLSFYVCHDLRKMQLLPAYLGIWAIPFLFVNGNISLIPLIHVFLVLPLHIKYIGILWLLVSRWRVCGCIEDGGE
jgi:hypothetical protein